MGLDKSTLGWITVMLTVFGFWPYIVAILKGKVKPHAISWFIWSLTVFITYVAQVVNGAGPGAWVSLSGGVATLMVFCLSLKLGERNIRVGDWISLMVAFSAIPIWALTDEALYAVIIVSIMDAVGFYPTVRKSYYKPHEELTFIYLVIALRFGISILALEQMNVVNWLYPVVIIIGNSLLVVMLLVRRKALRDEALLKSEKKILFVNDL